MTEKNASELESGTEEAPKFENETKSTSKITSAVLSYMAFSSTMLVTNKAAVMLFPAPSTLLFLQMAVSAVTLWILGKTKQLDVTELETSKIIKYVGVVASFIFNLFTNIKALQYTNVETVIVFQTLTSLGVAYGDYKLLKNSMPSKQVILSLLIIVLGSVLYVLTDSNFKLNGYFWVVMYFIAKITDMLYVKYIVDSVQMTPWGRSFYNNLLSLPPVLLIIFLTSEQYKVAEIFNEGITVGTWLIVGISCIMGLGISISGFICRALISATSFSVVGNMNKVLTVFINYFLIADHASPLGMLCLFICLFGGYYYSTVVQKK